MGVDFQTFSDSFSTLDRWRHVFQGGNTKFGFKTLGTLQLKAPANEICAAIAKDPPFTVNPARDSFCVRGNLFVPAEPAVDGGIGMGIGEETFTSTYSVAVMSGVGTFVLVNGANVTISSIPVRYNAFMDVMFYRDRGSPPGECVLVIDGDQQETLPLDAPDLPLKPGLIAIGGSAGGDVELDASSYCLSAKPG